MLQFNQMYATNAKTNADEVVHKYCNAINHVINISPEKILKFPLSEESKVKIIETRPL